MTKSPLNSPPTDPNTEAARGGKKGGRIFVKWSRRIFKGLFVAAGVFLALSAAGWGLLRIESVQRRLVDLIASRLSEQLHAHVTVDRVGGDLLTGLFVQNLGVVADREEMFHVDRLKVEYWLPTLFSGHWLIHSVEVDGLRVHLVREHDGSWNVEKLFPSGSSSEGAGRTAFAIRTVRIRSSRVSMSDEGPDPIGPLLIRDLNLDAGFSAGDRMAVNLRTLSFRLQSPSILIEKAGGRFEFFPEENTLMFRGVQMKTVRSEVRLDGRLFLGAEKGELALESDGVDLQEMARLFSLEGAPSEKVGGRLRVQGGLPDFTLEGRFAWDRASADVKGRIRGGTGKRPGIELTANVRGLNPARLPFPENRAPQGDLNWDMTLESRNGIGPDKEGQIRLQVLPSQVSGGRVEGGPVQVQWHGARLQVQVPRLEGSFGRFSADGILEGVGLGKELALETTVTGQNVDPARLLGDDRLQGNITGELRLQAKGPEKAWHSMDWRAGRGRLRGRLQTSSLAGIHIRDARFDARWDGKRLYLDSMQADAREGEVALSGWVAPEKRRLDLEASAAAVTLESLPVRRFFPEIPEPLKGRLSLKGRVEGSREDPRIHAVLKAEALQVAGLSAENLEMEARSKEAGRMGAHISVRSAVLSGHKAKEAEASVVLSSSRAEVAVKAQITDSLRVKAEGSVEPWQEGIRRVRIERLQVSGGDFPLENQGPLVLSLSPDAVEAHSLALFSREARFEARGRLAFHSQSDLALQWSGLDLSRISRFLPESFPLTGVSAGSGALSGVLQEPKVRGRIGVGAGTVRNAAFTSVETKFELNDGLLHVNARLDAGTASYFSVNGVLPLRLCLRPASAGWSDKEFNLSLSGSGWRLSALPIPQPSLPPIDGRLQVMATLAGPASNPAVSARFSLTEGEFLIREGGGAFPFSKFSADLRQTGSHATFSAFLVRDGARIAQMEASMGSRFSLDPIDFKPVAGSLKATIRADGLHLSAIPIPSRYGVAADGQLFLDLQVAGDLSAPRASGSLSVRKGSLTLHRYGLSYESVEVQMHLDNDRLQIETLHLSGDREGEVKLNGEVRQEADKALRFNLHLTGDKFLLPYRRALATRVRPDLLLTGRSDDPRLAGEMTILESRLNLDRLSDQGPAEIEVVGEEKEEGGPVMIRGDAEGGPSFLNPLAADVRVFFPNNTWMRGQGLNAEIGGDIRLAKKAGGPFVLEGSLAALRGFYVFRGKRFTIRRGEVTFIGLEDPNPNLDMEAAYRVRNRDIILRISGTARDMRLTLDSDPPMDQADIISILLFGRTTDEMKSAEAVNTERAALQMAGQLTAAQLNEIFGDAAVVDSFLIDPGQEDLGQGSVSVGKYVTPDVFVSVRQGFDLGKLQELEITYEVRPGLELETVVGEDTGYGLDLFWKHDFQ